MKSITPAGVTTLAHAALIASISNVLQRLVMI